jgi:hypothetical protein
MVISLSDFNNLSEKEKKKTLESMKQEIGVSGIVKAWEISRSKAYSMLREYNISLNRKISRTSKTKMKEGSSGNQNTATSSSGEPVSLKDQNKEQTIEGSGKMVAPKESPLDFDTKTDDSKFFLNLETQGTAPLINETIHALLGSGKISSANLHLSITIQEL